MARKLTRTVISLLMVFGISLAAVAPAHAHSATGNWSGNDVLCSSSSCVRSGNLVRFWQAIVWADDLTGSVGSSFIDGDFGPNTTTHTRNWQRNKSVGVDGIVGRQTWTKAHGAVNRSTSHDTSTHTGYFYYGWNRAFGLRQHKTNATWQFLNPRTNTWTGTGH